MKSLTTFCAVVLFSVSAFAAKHQSANIYYQSSFNGKISDIATCIEISDNIVRISSSDNNSYNNTTAYIDFNSMKSYNTAVLSNGDTLSTISDISFENGWELLNDTELILDRICNKARLVVNSNTIELFYTSDDSFWGTPAPRFGVTKGLILKIIINGSRIMEATKIDYLKHSVNLLPKSWGKSVSAPEYQKRLNESAVTTVNVFSQQRICFDTSIPRETQLSDTKVMRFANGTIVAKLVDLPDSAWRYNIFAELSQYSDGDAYDRTGSVFVIPMDKQMSFLDGLIYGIDTLPYFVDKSGKEYHGLIATPTYNPPVELIRFYTAFGTRKYNKYEYGTYHWRDSVVFKQDVSYLASLLSNKALIGVFIGNYDKNGHIINLDLKFHPNDENGVRTEVTPLFCTLNIMEMDGQDYPVFFESDTLSVDFNFDDNQQDIILSYIATGHGGWGGGDEFNKKPNCIQLDDKATSIIPWRYDCASYRESNPCSGNFNNGLSSSDYSRSGWCPGTITNPVEIFYSKLQKGKHCLKISIPQGQREGGSFSAWNVSGILLH